MDSTKQFPTGSVFSDLGEYWEEIAAANSTEKQLSFVKSILPLDFRVLDLACGTGRHSIQLVKAGYNIVGLDISGTLLQIAKKNAKALGVNCDFIKASMLYIPFKEKVFSAILSLDASFGYLSSENEDIQSFSEVHRILDGYGLFVLDIFNQVNILRRFGKSSSFNFRLWLFLFRLMTRVPIFFSLTARFFKWREYPNFSLLQKRTVNVKLKLLRDLWLFKNRRNRRLILSIHIVRLYSLLDIESLLKRAGLQIKQVYGNYKAEKYTETSNRLIVIVNKNQ